MMGAEQDNPRVVHKYDSDDRQLLVDLLHEYSEKLVDLSRKIILAGDQENRNLELTKLFSLVMALSNLVMSFCFSYLLWRFLLALSVSSTSGELIYHTIYNSKSTSTESLMVVLSTSLLLFALTSKTTIMSYFNGAFKDLESHKDSHLRKIESDLRERDAGMIAGKLASVMRLTVEITNQVETNLARKLELDLRLTDASYALEYYHSVVGLKDKPNPKRKKAPSKLSTFLRRFAFNQ